MKIYNTISDIRAFSREVRNSGKKSALVPTMGYLHEGHLSLIDTAHKYADTVIVSIFVNPTQFAPNEDLDQYPSDFKNDCKLCELRKVDAIFAPSPDEIYNDNASTWVIEEDFSKGLCSKTRPTHFRGVTTVVSKLFNITLPDIAVFGEKDYQQAAIIKRMVRDLNFPIEIITSPIVREKDGLAMSSRNKYLSCEERKNALAINRSLKEAENLIKDKNNSTPESVKQMINLRISQNSGKVDYIEILNPENLKPKHSFKSKTLIAVAAFYGSTRLLDNIII